jgi:uracil-DNA glycosylase family 4
MLIIKGDDMNIYEQYDTDLSGCTKCTSILCDRYVDPLKTADKVKPRPINLGIKKKPIMLIGQAPGLKEYETGKPFEGKAGQKIRKIFKDDIGISDFDEFVWSSAVVKCFAGREKVKKRGGSGDASQDMTPGVDMVNNCQSFLLRQIELVEPKVIVTLGRYSLINQLRLCDPKIKFNEKDVKLKDFVGKSKIWKGKTIIAFPHTSGGSTWLNESSYDLLFDNAKKLLRQELINQSVI